MIVATRPEPTVRPPSRTFLPVLWVLLVFFRGKIVRKWMVF